jgi:hypothetical protein
VRRRVAAHLDQLLPQVCVPEVLDLVVGSSGEVLRDGCPPGLISTTVQLLVLAAHVFKYMFV